MKTAIHPIMRCLALLIIIHLTMPKWAMAEDLNILLIMVDDLGKEWLGCYGADDVRTPHIDELAARGMLFNNYYCMPQCTPSRVTLLTGQYPFRHGWVNHWDVPRWGGGCSFDPDKNPSFPKLMRQAGWKTVAAGKWQIDDFRQEPTAMQQAGFENYCMWTGYETGKPKSAKRYQDPYIFCDGQSTSRPGKFGPDVFTDYLVDFIDQKNNRPFFMYFPMVLTHGPLVATPAEPSANTKLEKHKAMVRYTDQLVGRLMDALERNQLRDKTIVIFTTDNGSSQRITGHLKGKPVRGGKSKTSEAGICVPLIVSCPGTIPEGIQSNALVDITDFAATCCELAGVTSKNHVTDGFSFQSVLRGESVSSQRQWILAMGGGNHAKLTAAGVENQYWFRDRVLRTEDYKVYIGSDRKPEKLFHLGNDPDEQENLLASKDPKINSIRRLFIDAVSQMPKQDADPKYRPLPHRSWYLQPQTSSQVWKTGFPGKRNP